MAKVEVLKQKVDMLENEVKDLKNEVSQLSSRVRDNELAVTKIEIIVGSMKEDWKDLKTKIDKIFETKADKGSDDAAAQMTKVSQTWQTVVTEVLKFSTAIIIALLSAKIFLK